MMDPENPSNTSSNPAQAAASGRLEATQRQVNEVVDIMKTNVERIIEREDKLSHLDERANNLSMSASQFQTTSSRLKRKYWWKNLKMMLILGTIVVVIIIIIIVVCVSPGSSHGGDGGKTTPSSAATNHSRSARAIGYDQFPVV